MIFAVRLLCLTIVINYFTVICIPSPVVHWVVQFLLLNVPPSPACSRCVAIWFYAHPLFTVISIAASHRFCNVRLQSSKMRHLRAHYISLSTGVDMSAPNLPIYTLSNTN